MIETNQPNNVFSRDELKLEDLMLRIKSNNDLLTALTKYEIISSAVTVFIKTPSINE